MTDRELMQQALEALECLDALQPEPDYYPEDYMEARKTIAALRERLAQPEAPVLTGVDCSCGRKWRIVNNTLTASEPETVMAEYKHQTYAAYKTDGEMKIGVVPQRTHWEGCDEVHPECRKPEQEPVAWVTGWHDGHCVIRAANPGAILPIGIALYTAPPRRWVGLTETEQVQVAIDCGCADVAWLDFARAIEAKLREKNA